MLEIVSATLRTESDFWAQTALGQSLTRLAFDQRIKPCIHFSNRIGLPEIYNQHIVSNPENDLLVLMHDDVWIEDHFLFEHVQHGLEKFDVIGVAGNRRRVVDQPAWAFIDDAFTWDDRVNLSGALGQGQGPLSEVFYFGPSGVACELLDGVFLAARKSTLLASGIRFDEHFKFHFYDLDFCRSARHQGLTLGTAAIALTHQSCGGFKSETWQVGLKHYLRKWGN